MIIAKIDIINNKSISIESTPASLTKLEKLFTFSDMGQCFNGFNFDKDKIIKRKLLVRAKNIPHLAMLPIGLLKSLTDYLDKEGAKYKVFDKRGIPTLWEIAEKIHGPLTNEVIANQLSYLTLYDYQVDAVKACMESGNAIIKSPTGSGKCVVGDTYIDIEYDDEEIII